MPESGFAPMWASAPGTTIRERLDELSVDASEFAERLGEPADFVARLLDGQQPITVDLARRLSATLGASSEFWINRDCHYREDLARVETDDWLQGLPVAKMTEYGWLEGQRGDWAGRVDECLSFFDVLDVVSWRSTYEPMLAEVRMRISPLHAKSDLAVAAWLRQATRNIDGIAVGSWHPDALQAALPELKKLTRRKDPADFLPKLQGILADVGVALAVVRAIPGCPASGAARKLSSSTRMLVVSVRFLVDDQFWFTVFHEIGHLLLDHADHPILDDPGGEETDSLQEREANEFAAEALLPAALRAEVPAGRLTHRQVVALANRAGVSPGVVVGQLQHDNRVSPKSLNWIKRRYRWNSINLEMA